jgi:hypothetical protein
MAYDNGGINRDRSEARATRELRHFLDRVPFDRAVLAAIDAWLGTLSEEQMLIAVAGEETEMDALLASSPPFTGALLCAIFEEVC